jgi:Tfp pilus assembly protein PilV
MHRKQRGLSMIGFLFMAVLLIFVAMLAMKLVPAYIQFFSVKQILTTMGNDTATKSMSNAEIRNSFAKRAEVGYVTAVEPDDLSIERSGGKMLISADYVYRTPLIANISLVVDFSAASDVKNAPKQLE